MTPMLGIMSSGATGSKQSSFESIATVTAAGGEATLSFTSIAGTYKSLQIRGLNKGNGTETTMQSLTLRFNSDTGSNYARHLMFANGTTVTAQGFATETSIGITFGSIGGGAGNPLLSSFNTGIFDIVDYASTSKYKTVRGFSGGDSNGTTQGIDIWSGLWQSTSAITSITFGQGSNFKAGSTFALYGIKGA